jgi:small subunit ribosomal protein S5
MTESEPKPPTSETPAAPTESDAPAAPPAPTETTVQAPAPAKRRPPADNRGRGRGPRQQFDQDDKGLGEVVVKIGRCSTVVKGGRRFSFGALVVVGDKKGQVGIGYGKSVEVPSAIEKGKKIATRAMTPVKLHGGTIPHRVVGRYGASEVVMVPASPGTGVIAGASVRAVLELAGVHDILTKSYGSNTPKNVVRATFDGLMQLVSREEVERLRGVTLSA